MPAADLSAGFFGKIPATGDFVTRGLPSEFVRGWDQWVSRHLAPLQQSGIWDDEVVLRFLFGDEFLGPTAGVVLPSFDRAGRQFPFTVACRLTEGPALPDAAALDWFDRIARKAKMARNGELAADALATELSSMPFPPCDKDSATVQKAVMWVAGEELLDVDPMYPRRAIESLFRNATR